MTSPLQLAANQANAQLSTGPRTEAGKERCKLNAFRHGLTGQIHTFSPEDKSAFDWHCAAMRESFAPDGAFELYLVQSIAENSWRLNRARAIENGVFAAGQENAAPGDLDAAALAQARTWLSESRNLQLLTLYESRIQRSLDKALAQLAALQEKREAARQKALEEAQLLAQLDHMRGKPYDPAPDFPREVPEEPAAVGSVFSAAGVQRALVRGYRLDEVRFNSRRSWDPAVVYCRPDLSVPRAA